MYDELIKSLREDHGKQYFARDMEADDAIEELQKRVPKTPHGRLIDADALELMFADIDDAPYSGFDGIEPFYSADDAARIIRLAPTIIPAEEGET